MNENEIQKVDRKTVEEAIEFILQEGRMEGYQEAMKVYGKQYREILKKGRRQGLVLGIATAAITFVTWRKLRSDMKEKIKEELNDAKEAVANGPQTVEFEETDWEV